MVCSSILLPATYQIIFYGKTLVVLQPTEGYEPSGGEVACGSENAATSGT